MKNVFGYVRVSTAKQGEGVSLVAQRESIEKYAEKHNMTITRWFEEKETAAKQGRPLFSTMLKLLKKGGAEAVVMHKIDRSARNYQDWHTISVLMDEQKIFFAHENLDLQSRGGRLAADIQAVFATDYIRNLREETLKGIYGRIKQGIYPFPAPAGYVNNGGGQAKTVDPVQGQLVRRAFELYSTGRYTLESLAIHMQKLGLRPYRGSKIGKTGMSFVLKNSFYIGIMKVKDKYYNGTHEPLISTELFNKVQHILSGKTNQAVIKKDFKLRKRITCKICGYSLIGELQKGHTYYRCHTKGCLTKAIRETSIDNFILRSFKSVILSPEDYKMLEQELNNAEHEWNIQSEQFHRAIKLQAAQIEERLSRLTDCYIEGGLDKETYEARKLKLLTETKENAEALKNTELDKQVVLGRVERFLELSKSLAASYSNGNKAEQRELLEITTSNLMAEGKKLIISMRSPFHELCNREPVHYGAPTRDTGRRITMEFAVNGSDIEDITRSLFSRGQVKSFFLWLCDFVRETAKKEGGQDNGI